MTLPPQTNVCDDGARCASPGADVDSARHLVPGTVPATCADASERERCSFGGTLYDGRCPGSWRWGTPGSGR